MNLQTQPEINYLQIINLHPAKFNLVVQYTEKAFFMKFVNCYVSNFLTIQYVSRMINALFSRNFSHNLLFFSSDGIIRRRVFFMLQFLLLASEERHIPTLDPSPVECSGLMVSTHVSKWYLHVWPHHLPTWDSTSITHKIFQYGAPCYTNPFKNTDKLRINGTFRQQMTFFGHFGPNLIPILEKNSFLHRQCPFLSVWGRFLELLGHAHNSKFWDLEESPPRNPSVYGPSRFRAQARRFRCHLGSRLLLSS